MVNFSLVYLRESEGKAQNRNLKKRKIRCQESQRARRACRPPSHTIITCSCRNQFVPYEQDIWISDRTVTGWKEREGWLVKGGSCVGGSWTPTAALPEPRDCVLLGTPGLVGSPKRPLQSVCIVILMWGSRLLATMDRISRHVLPLAMLSTGHLITQVSDTYFDNFTHLFYIILCTIL